LVLSPPSLGSALRTAKRGWLHFSSGGANTLIHNEDRPLGAIIQPREADAGFMINHPQTDMVKELLI
jgi:hypothetical protein